MQPVHHHLRLKFEFCDISLDGAEALVARLPPQLQEVDLDLSRCRLDRAAEERLAGQLQARARCPSAASAASPAVWPTPDATRPRAAGRAETRGGVPVARPALYTLVSTVISIHMNHE